MDWQFSPKQICAMTWWQQYPQALGIICEGSIRSGKTVALSISFLLWCLDRFNHMQFAMCGKSIESFRRNVLKPLMEYSGDFGITIAEHRADHYIHVSDGKHSNDVYYFGGLNERSQDLIQGMTLAGLYLDEVALMPESFVNQAMGRCSVTGAKIFMNCNPDDPSHFIKKQFVDLYREKGYIHMHFMLEDNYSLSEERMNFYKSQYRGVFYKRFILGEWCAAEGAIYTIFAEDPSRFLYNKNKETYMMLNIGIDYGASRSRTTMVASAITRDRKLVILEEKAIEGIIEPNALYAQIARFTEYVAVEYQCPNHIFADYGALGQDITLGLRRYMAKNSKVAVKVEDCYKGAIYDRIISTLRLMGQDRFLISHNCPQLQAALVSAVWEEGKINVRLDNNSYSVDLLDAMEYSFYSYAQSVLML